MSSSMTKDISDDESFSNSGGHRYLIPALSSPLEIIYLFLLVNGNFAHTNLYVYCIEHTLIIPNFCILHVSHLPYT